MTNLRRSSRGSQGLHTETRPRAPQSVQVPQAAPDGPREQAAAPGGDLQPQTGWGSAGSEASRRREKPGPVTRPRRTLLGAKDPEPEGAGGSHTSTVLSGG